MMVLVLGCRTFVRSIRDPKIRKSKDDTLHVGIRRHQLRNFHCNLRRQLPIIFCDQFSLLHISSFKRASGWKFQARNLRLPA